MKIPDGLRGLLPALVLALASLAPSSAAQGSTLSPDAQEYLRRIARNLQALELATYGLDHDQYRELLRRREEIRVRQERALRDREARQRALEEVRRRKQELLEYRETRQILEQYGVADPWDKILDMERRAAEFDRRGQELSRERAEVDRSAQRIRSQGEERLDSLRDERWSAGYDLAREGLLLSAKTAKYATLLTPGGRAGRLLKQLRPLAKEADDLFGAADSVHDYLHEDDRLGMAEELTTRGLEGGNVERLLEELGVLQDALDFREAAGNARDAWDRLEATGEEMDRVEAETIYELQEQAERRAEVDSRQTELDRDVDEYEPSGEAYRADLEAEARSLDRVEETLQEDIREDEAALESSRRQEEELGIPPLAELELDPESPLEDQVRDRWEDLSRSEEQLDSELGATWEELDLLDGDADLLEAVTDTLDVENGDEPDGLAGLLEEIEAEVGPSDDGEVERLAEELHERMFGDEETWDSGPGDVVDEFGELLDAEDLDGAHDLDSWMDSFDGEPLVDPSDLGSEEAAGDFDLDQAFLTDHFESVYDGAAADTSGDRLLADFQDLVDRIDVRGRMLEGQNDVRERLDSEMASLDDRLARALEERRRDTSSPFEFGGKSLAEHLGELAETYDRAVLGNRAGPGRRPGSIRADYDPFPGGYGTSFGGSGSPSPSWGGFSSAGGGSSGSMDGIFIPWSGGGGGAPSGSGSGAPSLQGVSSMSEIYRKSAEMHRWAASQTDDPAQKAEYLRAAEEAERLASSLGTGR